MNDNCKRNSNHLLTFMWLILHINRLSRVPFSRDKERKVRYSERYVILCTIRYSEVRVTISLTFRGRHCTHTHTQIKLNFGDWPDIGCKHFHSKSTAINVCRLHWKATFSVGLGYIRLVCMKINYKSLSLIECSAIYNWCQSMCEC